MTHISNASTANDEPVPYDDDPGAYQSSLENTLVNGSTPSPRPPPPRASAGVYQSSESDSDPDDDMPLDALRNKTKHVAEKRKADAMSSSDRSSFGEGSDITPQPPQQKGLKRTKAGHRRARRSAQNNFRCDAESLASTSHLDGPPPLVLSRGSTASSSTTDEELPHTPHESPQIQGDSLQKDEDVSSWYEDSDYSPSRLARGYRTDPDLDLKEISP